MTYNLGEVNSPWASRISNSLKAKKAWEDKFKCKKLEEYYEGFQWKSRGDGSQIAYNPYTLNLFHSTIEIKLASYLFQRPSFVLSPEPGQSHWDLDFAVQSAQIKQDALNTIIKNRNLKFTRHLKLAALDAFFRFGMIEVGYAADWRNPLKEEVHLKSWDDPEVMDTPKDRVVEDREIPINERFYVKRIKPDRFLTSVCDAEDMEDHEWVGYCQYYYADTLKKTKGIKFPDDYSGAYRSSDFDFPAYQKSEGGLYAPYSGRDICKTWHIWDLVSKKRLLLLADSEHTELWSADFERLPLIDLRWFYRLNGFYPIPPCWYWLSPQDEINESREQIRSYRRRFTSKFQYLESAIDDEEVEKFVSGPDGVMIKTKQVDAIKAIENPGMGPISENALIQAKDDFLVVSGTSAEARPGGDRETATKSKIADARSRIRESAEQLEFSEFVCTIGREILCQAQEKLVGELWVKMTSGPGQQALQDVVVNQPIYQSIAAQDLSDGYDFEIAIDVQNATPAAMEAEKEAYINFVMFLQQVPMIAMSPVLIRETAYRFGYKNEQVIHQMQQVAVAAMAAKAAAASQGNMEPAAQMAPGQNGGGGQNTQQKQMQTPDSSTIGTQLTNQLQ